MSPNQIRTFVVMKLPAPVPALLKVAAAILAAVTNNPNFANAAALIAALGKAITTLDTAETATKTRAAGTVAARDAARAQLEVELNALKSMVQQAADANPEQAEAIIASAGLAVRKPTSRRKAPFAAQQGPTSGTVKLVAKAVATRASYDWEWSADGGKTWTLVPSTLQAKTTVTGIPAGTAAQFRFRCVTKVGAGDWSQPISLIVK